MPRKKPSIGFVEWISINRQQEWALAIASPIPTQLAWLDSVWAAYELFVRTGLAGPKTNSSMSKLFQRESALYQEVRQQLVTLMMSQSGAGSGNLPSIDEINTADIDYLISRFSAGSACRPAAGPPSNLDNLRAWGESQGTIAERQNQADREFHRRQDETRRQQQLDDLMRRYRNT